MSVPMAALLLPGTLQPRDARGKARTPQGQRHPLKFFLPYGNPAMHSDNHHLAQQSLQRC